MRALTSALALLALGAVATASTCSEIDGNYYCDEVDSIVYENVGFSGSYDEVTDMSSDCVCSTSSTSFSGSLAPLNQDVSIHFRGPINIKQVAVYTSSSASSTKRRLKKREASPAPAPVAKRSEHEHALRHALHLQKRDLVWVTEVVTVVETVWYDPESTTLQTTAPVESTITTETIAGETLVAAVIASPETITVASSEAASTSASSAPAAVSTSSTPITTSSSSPVESPSTFVVVTTTSSSSTSTTSSIASSSSSSSSSSASASATASTGDWSRIAYYDSESGSSSGITFMNNLGGTNSSGVWDTCWGNSLSYANTDGQTAAAEAQILDDVEIPSDYEVIIFSDTPCTTDVCGYSRDGVDTFVGFSGDYKMFLFEFGMPTATDSATANYDMPAIWFLNGRIPRTQQYGSCSCWTSGCGELDVFEVLSSGLSYMTTTLHSWQGTGTEYGGGGSSDYFARPTSGTMKAAIIFDGSDESIYLVTLDDSVDFDTTITADTIDGWIANIDETVTISS
ncbi:putative TOS1-like glycosyl hydrolase-domain-containing protein [Limtongia smithiae]|uniref:putative TOS1-like glycosyl hydrolase-domain-containing protein n=1 Tax=Limtongia smithiae TaxID=1125753 RepID=UPI0034CD5F56